MRYNIYQLKSTPQTRYAKFEEYNIAKKEIPTLSLERDYDKVYTGCMSSRSDILNILFQKFNTERPPDFTGHSLSVSDIIEVDGVYYYVQPIGFLALNASLEPQ